MKMLESAFGNGVTPRGLREAFSAAASGRLGNTTQTNTVAAQLLLFFLPPGGSAVALSKQRPLSYENIKKVYALRRGTTLLKRIS